MTDRNAYMLVRRDRLERIMAVTGQSSRQVARAAGWKSHSYLLRILRGTARTVSPVSGLRIAHHFGVPIEHLFTPVVYNAAERILHRARTETAA